MKNKRLSTGIVGFNKILNGGLITKRAYLVRGGPGTGKTTFGLHFLSIGAEKREKSLLISLMESKNSIYNNAKNRSYNLENIEILDLSPACEFVTENKTYNIYPSQEIEQKPIIENIIDKIEDFQPKRIFLDGIKQLKFLSNDKYQYRKQVLSFIRYVTQMDITVLISSEASQNEPDEDLQFICDGVFNLEYSYDERFIGISKFRGSAFREGKHSFIITNEGIKLYPKIKTTVYSREYTTEVISSGIPELDELLHGGLERGTDTLISGPTGVGKTSLGLQFMKEAAGRGERSVVYTFEESVETLINRSENINIPIKRMIDTGKLSVVKINPLEYSPDQFANMVQSEVEKKMLK